MTVDGVSGFVPSRTDVDDPVVKDAAESNE